MDLEFLIRKRCFDQSGLLSPTFFASYCEERGLKLRTSGQLLEPLHEHEFLRPIVRLERPKYIEKVWVDEQGQQWARPLEPDEEWEGETRETSGGLTLDGFMLPKYLDAGLIGNPTDEQYRPWRAARADGILEETSSWGYSPFQVIAVRNILSRLSLPLSPAQLVSTASGEPVPAQGAKFVAGFNLKLLQSFVSDFEPLLELLLRIQNRYLPYTRRNRPFITVRDAPFLDWREWCRAFDPNEVLSASPLSTDDLIGWARTLTSEARSLDPLERWSGLRDVASHNAQLRLRGDALLALDFYQAAEVIERFLADVDGKPFEGTTHQQRLDRLYGPGWLERRQEVAGYVCADIGIHPEPNAVVFAEDDGLVTHVLPQLIDAAGPAQAEELGIELRRLKGTGGINKDKLLAPLEHLVSRGIRVWFIFDNENRAEEAWQRVRESFRKAHPTLADRFDRCVTRHMWSSTFEFDNFTDEEIASCLSEMASPERPITAAAVSSARATFHAPVRTTPLEEVVAEHPDGGTLSKTTLAERLCAMALERPSAFLDGIGETDRPIISVVVQIAQAAVDHRKPNMPPPRLRT